MTTTLIPNLILLLGLSLFIACSSDEDPPHIITEDFEVEGRWIFTDVEFDGTVYGIPQKAGDESPEGFVEFNADGTGSSDFSINILGYEFGETFDMTWERTANNEVTLEKANGEVVVWTILSADMENVTAEWEKVVSSLNKGTFNAELVRE